MYGRSYKEVGQNERVTSNGPVYTYPDMNMNVRLLFMAECHQFSSYRMRTRQSSDTIKTPAPGGRSVDRHDTAINVEIFAVSLSVKISASASEERSHRRCQLGTASHIYHILPSSEKEFRTGGAYRCSRP